MSTVDFQHITTSMVGEVAVVEILAKELRFPLQAQEVRNELTLVAGQDWAKQLLVSMKHIKFLSSTGFAILFHYIILELFWSFLQSRYLKLNKK